MSSEASVVMMALASTTIPSTNVLVFLRPSAIAAYEPRIRRGLLSPLKDLLCEGLWRLFVDVRVLCTKATEI